MYAFKKRNVEYFLYVSSLNYAISIHAKLIIKILAKRINLPFDCQQHHELIPYFNARISVLLLFGKWILLIVFADLLWNIVNQFAKSAPNIDKTFFGEKPCP
jgi:Ca2+/H+ antiporter